MLNKILAHELCRKLNGQKMEDVAGRQVLRTPPGPVHFAVRRNHLHYEVVYLPTKEVVDNYKQGVAVRKKYLDEKSK